jgi:hypothetical protein
LAGLRAAAARKAGLKVYKQHIVLAPTGLDGGENRVTRLVRGFLVRRLKGKEVIGH